MHPREFKIHMFLQCLVAQDVRFMLIIVCRKLKIEFTWNDLLFQRRSVCPVGAPALTVETGV